MPNETVRKLDNFNKMTGRNFANQRIPLKQWDDVFIRFKNLYGIPVPAFMTKDTASISLYARNNITMGYLGQYNDVPAFINEGYTDVSFGFAHEKFLHIEDSEVYFRDGHEKHVSLFQGVEVKRHSFLSGLKKM